VEGGGKSVAWTLVVLIFSESGGSGEGKRIEGGERDERGGQRIGEVSFVRGRTQGRRGGVQRRFYGGRGEEHLFAWVICLD